MVDGRQTRAARNFARRATIRRGRVRRWGCSGRTPGAILATTPRKPRYGLAALKALDQLGLDDSVDMAAIKARYKDLVKRLHPDANAGDRSNEDKLREIIRAYNYLRTVKQA